MDGIGKNLVASVVLGASLLGGATVLGERFKNLRQQGTITVKGLAEEQHQADYAEWTVGVHVWGADYGAALEKTRQALAALTPFLHEWGFKPEEIATAQAEIEVHQEEFRNERGETEFRNNGYDGKRNVHISTRSLDKIARAQEAIQALRARNASVHFGAPRYYLSGLEKIKLEMIGKATQDARARAERFVAASNAKVGQMKRASQGSFNIHSATTQETDDDYGGSYSTETVDKKVRLVVTVEYGID